MLLILCLFLTVKFVFGDPPVDDVRHMSFTLGRKNHSFFFIKDHGHFTMDSSDNVGNWTPVPDVMENLYWKKEEIYYPHLFLSSNNQNRLFYNTLNKTNGELMMNVAISFQPSGPYHAMCSAIGDHLYTHIFVFEEDNIPYIYYVIGNEIQISVLDPEYLNFNQTNGTTVLKPSFQWENGTVSHPALVKYKNEYYMFYTGGNSCSFSRGVSVARAPSPLGPFSKYGARLELRETDCEYIGEPYVMEEKPDVWHIFYEKYEKIDGKCSYSGLSQKQLEFSDLGWPFVLGPINNNDTMGGNSTERALSKDPLKPNVPKETNQLKPTVPKEINQLKPTVPNETNQLKPNVPKETNSTITTDNNFSYYEVSSMEQDEQHVAVEDYSS